MIFLWFLLDPCLRNRIFDQVIGNKGLLRRKTRIMITKDPRFLQKFDYIIVMKNQVKRKKTFTDKWNLMVCKNYISSHCTHLPFERASQCKSEFAIRILTIYARIIFPMWPIIQNWEYIFTNLNFNGHTEAKTMYICKIVCAVFNFCSQKPSVQGPFLQIVRTIYIFLCPSLHLSRYASKYFQDTCLQRWTVFIISQDYLLT